MSTLTTQVSDLTAQVAVLTELLTKATTTLPEKVEVRATVELDEKTYRRHIKSVARFVKGGDTKAPVGYKQRKFLCALGGKSVNWESFNGWTAGQAAVAIKLLKDMTPVTLDATTVIPQPLIKR